MKIAIPLGGRGNGLLPTVTKQVTTGLRIVPQGQVSTRSISDTFFVIFAIFFGGVLNRRASLAAIVGQCLRASELECYSILIAAITA